MITPCCYCNGCRTSHLHRRANSNPMYFENSCLLSQSVNQNVTVDLLVVKDDGPTLMGRDWLQQITLDWHSLHQIQATHNTALESLIAKHQEVFAYSLEKVENFTAKLHVSPDAQPCYYRPWPVPHSLRTKLEKQLQHLESLGIIEPVQFSDWAALIVPVLKANGELRVCGDYHTTR